MFQRYNSFQISGEVFGDRQEAFPRLDNPKEWFPLFLFPGSTQTSEMKKDIERDIARAGRRDMSAMTQYYLTTLPRETMRVPAGFTVGHGSFWISREPPSELQEMVFPHVSV